MKETEAHCGAFGSPDGMSNIMFVKRVRMLMMREHERFLKIGLSHIDLAIAALLLRDECIDTAKDIQRKTPFSKSHISQSLKRLEEEGYIEVRRDKKDRRVSHHIPTDKCRMLVQEVMDGSRRVREIIFRGFSEEERSCAEQFFRRMNENIEREIRQENHFKDQTEEADKLS